MAVVRPSGRPSGPPDPPERAYRLVPVPLSHRQAPPLLVEPDPSALTPAQALRPLVPTGLRPLQAPPELRPRDLPEADPPAPAPAPPLARPVPMPLEPVSPELALVSPELAEEARAELPELELTVERPAPLPAAARLRVERPRPVRTPPPTPQERRYVPGERVPPRSRPRDRQQRRRIPTSTFVLLALGVFVAVTSALPARDAPTLLAPPPKAKARPAKPRTAPPPLVAGAVYAEGDRLRLRVGGNGRRLSGTTGALPCAPAGVSFRAAVARDGSFRGTVRGRHDRLTGTVLGRFGPRTAASGVIRVRRPECDSGPVLFVAGIPTRR